MNKVTNSRISTLNILKYLTSNCTSDVTIYCKDGSNERYGGLSHYLTCLDCDCHVFELLCLEQSESNIASYNLYSRSLDHAKTCKNCVCNSSSIEWAY